MIRDTESNKPDNNYAANCFHFLSMLFLTIMLGTYVLAYKMVSIGGYIISGGIFIFPINYAITDITTEVYGYEQTKKLIKVAFICCLFFALTVPIIAIWSPPEGWPYQSGYTHVLGSVFRFFIANTIGIIIGIRLNGYLIAKWKIMMQGKHFWLRSIGSSAIGELTTSIIADIIAFAGTTDALSVIKIMLGIFSIKMVYSILLSLPSSLVVTHIRLKAGAELINFNLNPFNQTLKYKKDLNVFNY